MSQAVLVRGHRSRWTILLRLAGPALMVVGLIVCFFNLPPGIVVAVSGVALVAIVEPWLLIIRRSRRWVEDTPGGFSVTDISGSRSYRDEQVLSLAYFQKRVHSEGILKSVARSFLVWLDTEPDPIEMWNDIPLGQEDPLGGLVNRLLDKSKARADESLLRGGQIAGVGWSLDRAYLTISSSVMPEQIRFDDLAAVDVFDDHLCIWRRGQDEAVARIPVRTRDAHLLHLLLAERITEQSDAAATFAGETLGRVLFERKANRVLTAVLWLSIPTALLVGSFCLAIPDSRIAGVVILLVSPLLAVAALACQVANFRCHERGVYKRGLFGSRQLRYADVAAFTYSATRHYHNGAYVGTNLVLRFDPPPGTPTKSVAYNTTVKAADDALDALRDHVSRFLAYRMSEEFRNGGSVTWTPNLAFSPEGLVYRPGGLLGRKEPVLLPYEQFGGYDFNQGAFRLWEKGNPKPVCTEQSSTRNFYPGYYLLLDLFYSGEGAG